MSMWPLIFLHTTGLEKKRPLLARSLGNWGPESEGSDCLKHPLKRNGKWWVFENPERLLTPGELFKIVVPEVTLDEAHRIHKARVAAGVHESEPRTDAPEGENFDFDHAAGCMWFLADGNPDIVHGGYPTFRGGKWDRNSVFVLVLLPKAP